MAPTTAPIKPAPSPARYQPMACPRYVATREPTIPSAAVRIKPDGSFDDPGWRNLATMPATKPMIMVQMILILHSPNPIALYFLVVWPGILTNRFERHLIYIKGDGWFRSPSTTATPSATVQPDEVPDSTHYRSKALAHSEPPGRSVAASSRSGPLCCQFSDV